MVKAKGGRLMNPADAHRKAQRKKEIKKNKVERKKVREVAMAVKDTTKLELEIAKYEELGMYPFYSHASLFHVTCINSSTILCCTGPAVKEKRLDKNGHAKLTQLQEQLDKIVKTKEAHNIPLAKPVPKQPPKYENPDDPKNSPYYHPTLNPLGLAPSRARQAGYQIPHTLGQSHKDEASNEDSDESLGSDASGAEEDDDELPELPPGTPPKHEEATGEDDDGDELPELPPGTPPRKEEEEEEEDMPELPPGPPPSKPFQYGAAQSGPSTVYASYPGAPPPPPPRPGGVPPFDMRSHHMPPGGPSPFANRPLPPPPPPRSPQHYGPYPSGPRYPGAPPPPRPAFSHYGPSVGRPPRSDYYNPDFGSFSPPLPGPPPPGPPPGVYGEASPSPASAATVPPARPQLALAPVISAAPQVRDLRKELTTLVPASILRKKAAAAKAGAQGAGKVARPKINAAPDLDEGVSESSVAAVGPALPTGLPTTKAISGGPAAAPAKGKKKTTDEYAKFMREMEGLL
ncbi:hypothetical protein BC936DRAFT_145871 [Jimgerdemannia flammicorona]|uniref:Wbp11/ELF5/Saf1 N-terminal domain-containing protein n=1 Tax=Jimgerdemannia flammicorona TaxID=994334 RepID=A0A433D8V8_9FUNG|nr:hypothetical protein BC936DRAFT_145871 [Jimgerdemannia flammicorona]